MWVQEKDVHHFEYRSGLVVVTKVDAVDAGIPLEMFYKLLGMSEFSESLVRTILQHMYGDISKWNLIVVFYDAMKDAWVIRVESPDFEPVPMGAIPPEILKRRELTHGE